MKNSSLWIGLTCLFLSLILWIFTPYLLFSIFAKYELDWDILSKIGDTFNGTGTLISAISLMMVIISIYFQRLEIRNQRDDSNLNTRINSLMIQINIYNTQLLIAEQNKNVDKISFLNIKITELNEELKSIIDS